MKKWYLITLLVLLFGCETYETPTDPSLFLGGGKWTLIDYEINVIANSSGSEIIIFDNDTVCISPFYVVGLDGDNFVMKQDYNNTSVGRRFVKYKTQWEFEGNELYCEWEHTTLGDKPLHQPLQVDFPLGYYTDYSQIRISNTTTSDVTTYSFDSNNVGVIPPNELVLVSPPFTMDVYSSGNDRSKTITLKVILVFMR